MKLNQSLLPEFAQEMANTRKTLERVPEDKFAWKPHEKSFSIAELATHLGNIPQWVSSTIEADEYDIAPVDGPAYKLEAAKSLKEILDSFDSHIEKAGALIAGASDECLLQPWSLKKGGKPLFSMPRLAVLRGFVMNHAIHHRAQLGVYLRLNNLPVPAVYGPSADEGEM